MTVAGPALTQVVLALRVTDSGVGQATRITLVITWRRSKRKCCITTRDTDASI